MINDISKNNRKEIKRSLKKEFEIDEPPMIPLSNDDVNNDSNNTSSNDDSSRVILQVELGKESPDTWMRIKKQLQENMGVE